MIKSNELRIGNWVQDEHGDIMFVYRIWQDGVELSADATGKDDIDYQDQELFGIPLSVDFLVKNKYKTKHYTVMARFDKFQINGVKYEVKYIHQLQNIHFILTGEELLIKW